MDYVYQATAEDTGSREGTINLGLFLTPESAHKAVMSFDPHDEGDAKWVVRASFDQTHVSGAVHVTRYSLEGSRWWVGHVIKFEVRP